MKLSKENLRVGKPCGRAISAGGRLRMSSEIKCLDCKHLEGDYYKAIKHPIRSGIAMQCHSKNCHHYKVKLIKQNGD